MNLDISLIPKGMLYKALPGLGAFLETASGYSRGRTTPDDLVGAFYSGHYQLWVVHDADLALYGFFATNVKEYPRKRMLCIQHCVMEPHHMALVEPRMQELAEKYAKDAQCHGVEFIGRPGWKRHAERYGYKASSVCYQKFFGEDTK